MSITDKLRCSLTGHLYHRLSNKFPSATYLLATEEETRIKNKAYKAACLPTLYAQWTFYHTGLLGTKRWYRMITVSIELATNRTILSRDVHTPDRIGDPAFCDDPLLTETTFMNEVCTETKRYMALRDLTDE
jgi:hypothetical protein